MVRWLLLLASGCFFKPEAPLQGAGDAHIGDGQTNSDGIVSSSDGMAGVANYVFVTSSTFAIQQADITNGMVVSKADTLCNFAAQNGTPPKLVGYYVAWLSSNAEGAADRLRSKAARGWIRPDGTAFADTVQNIADGLIRSAPALDENRQVVPGTVSVATGTLADGTATVGANADCSGGNIEVGHQNTMTSSWTAYGYVPCGTTGMRLYCFGWDRSVPVP